MYKSRIPCAIAVALVSVFGMAAATSSPAHAGGRSGLSKVDARAGVIGKFWRCIEGKRCPENQVFRGKTALSDWRRAKQKITQINVLGLAMVTTVPAKWRARFKRRWGKYVPKLVAGGYRKGVLGRIGLGKSIVTAKSRVALAFMSIQMQRRGRTKTEYLFLVLWKVKRRWYVAYFEDSPRKITRFLLNNKPH